MRQKTRRVRRLRSMRRALDITQMELSRRSGISTATICVLERGLSQPTLSTAQAIAAVFGRSVEEVFEVVEVPVS